MKMATIFFPLPSSTSNQLRLQCNENVFTEGNRGEKPRNARSTISIHQGREMEFIYTCATLNRTIWRSCTGGGHLLLCRDHPIPSLPMFTNHPWIIATHRAANVLPPSSHSDVHFHAFLRLKRTHTKSPKFISILNASRSPTIFHRSFNIDSWGFSVAVCPFLFCHNLPLGEEKKTLLWDTPLRWKVSKQRELHPSTSFSCHCFWTPFPSFSFRHDTAPTTWYHLT